MRDAIELEWAGVPSVLVVHDSLRGSAEAMRSLSGHPDYPYVSFGEPANPNARWTQEEIDQVVEQIAPAVIARLTSAETP